MAAKTAIADLIELRLANGVKEKVKKEMESCNFGDADYSTKMRFLEAILISCDAVIAYANRYAVMAEEMAEKEMDAARRQELLTIAKICKNVPEFPAESFQEACQSFWFIQQVLQIEASGHSISPGRFDQYMYPYYEKDIKAGSLTREYAQELIDCIWVKLNDLNKCRDAASAEGFADTLPGVRQIHILPYHNFGQGKYEGLNRDYPIGDDPRPSDESISGNNSKEYIITLPDWWLTKIK